MNPPHILLVQMNVAMKDTAVCVNHGLATIAAVLKQAGCRVQLEIIDDKSYSAFEVLPDIDLKEKDLIGFSAYSNQWEYVVNYAARLKQKQDIPIVCGGPHVSVCPDALSAAKSIDAIVVGEGEEAARQIAERLQRGSDWLDVPGVRSRQKDGMLRQGQAAKHIVRLDDLPFPDYQIYSRQVVLNYPGVIFSRGCPYDCSYCINHVYRKIFPKDTPFLRVMSPEKAVELARHYRDAFNPPRLMIDDDTFTKSPAWLEEFLGRYRKEVNLPFYCNVRPETVTQSIAQKLRECGCVHVSIGLESGDEHIRRNILKRPMPDETIARATRLIHENGIRFSTFNMVGLPGETWEKYHATVELNRRLRPDSVQMSIYYPYRGTELGDSACANGLVQEGQCTADYFGGSIMKILGFPKWQIVLAKRLFKFLVFWEYAKGKACFELLKDCIKSLPSSHRLIGPYLRVKRLICGNCRIDSVTQNIARPARVLWIMPALGPGGSERFTLGLLAGWPSSKIKVDLLALKNIVSYDLPVGLSYTWLCDGASRLRYHLVGVFFRLARMIRHYDLIVVGQEIHLPLLLLPLLWRKRRITVLHSQLSFFIRHKAPLFGPFHAFVGFLYSRYHQIVAVSEGCKKDLVEGFGVPPDKVTCIHNGVDIPEQASPVIKKTADGKVRLLTVGRLTPEKNMSFLLDVFAAFTRRERGIDATLTICGHGEMLDSLRHKASSMGLSPRVHWVGLVKDVDKYYQEATIYVQPSLWEGFGMAILEAMQWGLPIIASCCDGPKEILSGTPLLISNYDVGEYCAAINKLVSDRDFYQRMADFSLERVRHFSLSAARQRYLDVFQETLCQNR